MIQYQVVVRTGSDEMNRQLNELAHEGWRLVGPVGFNVPTEENGFEWEFVGTLSREL